MGSQKTPDDVCKLISRFNRLQSRRCRTGGARGADEASETNWEPYIFLPHIGWRGKQGIWRYSDDALDYADEVLKYAFPYDITSDMTRAFFRRNVWQVIEVCTRDADARPSDFLICWTPDGALSSKDYMLGITGGTGIAINVASLFSVKVINLKIPKHRAAITQWCFEKEEENGLKFEPYSGLHFDPETGVIVSGVDIRRRRGEGISDLVV